MTMRTVIRAVSLAAALAASAVPVRAGDHPCASSSTIPQTIYLVGMLGHGAPDPVGQAVVVLRRFGTPVANERVVIDLSECCDLVLCPTPLPGQTVDCDARTVSGFTDAQGVFRFTVLGAAQDAGPIPPAQVPGCGQQQGAKIYGMCPELGMVLLGTAIVPALDLNGAAGGSNGTSISDVAVELLLFGTIALGTIYRGRGDLNGDRQITITDVGLMLGHMGRLSLLGGASCPGTFCARPPCSQ